MLFSVYDKDGCARSPIFMLVIHVAKSYIFIFVSIFNFFFAAIQIGECVMLLWMGSVDIPIGDSTTSKMANMLPHQLIPKVIWVGGDTTLKFMGVTDAVLA